MIDVIGVLLTYPCFRPTLREQEREKDLLRSSREEWNCKSPSISNGIYNVVVVVVGVVVVVVVVGQLVLLTLVVNHLQMVYGLR